MIKFIATFLIALLPLCISAQKTTPQDTSLIKNIEDIDKDSLFTLGMRYAYGDGVAKSAIEAVSLWEKAASKGHAEAMWYLGFYYENGYGVKASGRKAYKWYYEAAQADYSDAMYDLGRCFYHGIGVSPDIYQTIKWWTNASKLENTSAQYHLGEIYATGDGIKQNKRLAYYFFQKAALNGNETAKEIIDLMNKRR